MNEPCKSSHRKVKQQLEALYDELFAHDGYADLRVEFRILKRGQKEVILHCGKQFRYVLDYRPLKAVPAMPEVTAATSGGDEALSPHDGGSPQGDLIRRCDHE